jgi:adenine nucleotide transporter 17
MESSFFTDTFRAGLIGSLSSGITGTLLFPLENVKIRLQLADKSRSKVKMSFYQEMVSTMKMIIEKEGVRGLYSGLTQYLIYNMSQWGVYFYFREFFRDYFNKHNLIQNLTLRNIVCNYLAGIVNVFLICPLSVLFNYVVSKKKSSGVSLSMAQACRDIYAKNGFKGFYKGLGVALILVINPTINISIFNLLKKTSKKMDLKILNNFVSGGISKLIATLLTFPLNTIKVNQQGKNSKKGILIMVLTILMRSGPKGFYKGLSTKIIQSVLHNGIMLHMKENLTKVIK